MYDCAVTAQATLKDGNRTKLLAAASGHALLLYLICAVSNEVTADQLLASLTALGKSHLALVAGGVGWLATEITPRDLKHRLIHGLSPRLPGRRAFSVIGPADHRVDMQALRERLGELPALPEEQDCAWFELYKEFEGDVRVRSTHGRLLFVRDLTWMTAVVCLVAPVIVFLVTKDWVASLFALSVYLLLVGIFSWSSYLLHVNFCATVLSCVRKAECNEHN